MNSLEDAGLDGAAGAEGGGGKAEGDAGGSDSPIGEAGGDWNIRVKSPAPCRGGGAGVAVGGAADAAGNDDEVECCPVVLEKPAGGENRLVNSPGASEGRGAAAGGGRGESGTAGAAGLPSPNAGVWNSRVNSPVFFGDAGGAVGGGADAAGGSGAGALNPAVEDGEGLSKSRLNSPVSTLPASTAGLGASTGPEAGAGNEPVPPAETTGV